MENIRLSCYRPNKINK